MLKIPFQRIAPGAPWCCKLRAKIDLQSAMSCKSIPQILLSLRIEELRSTYAATRTSRRGVRCSVWFLLVHVVRLPVVASNLSRRPLQITPKPSSFQTKCNFEKEILLRFFFWDGSINVIETTRYSRNPGLGIKAGRGNS